MQGLFSENAQKFAVELKNLFEVSGEQVLQRLKKRTEESGKI